MAELTVPTASPAPVLAGQVRNLITQRLERRVSAQSLACFRVLFGALIAIDCWRFIAHDRIWRYWVAPELHFTYPGFGWVAPLPEPWIQWAWLIMGLSAIGVMVGLFYRFSIVVMTALFTYFFLLDAAEYLNHFYLVILFAVLMCFLPANRVWSLDALRRPSGEADIPYAAVFILRAQIEIMLIYAGLVKLTPDWLAGEPLGMWLRPQSGQLPFGLGALLHYDWVIIAASWGTIVLHLLGALLLLWQRSRLAVFLIYCCFHIANAYFFNIGIFPWLTIAATTIFFAPDWPNRVMARFRGERAPKTASAPPRGLPRLALGALTLWIAVQVTLPLRGALFPTEVRWSGDGHRFSWRMRIFDRHAEGHFTIIAADGTRWRIHPVDYLTERQADKMLVRPDLIHQFALYLERLWDEHGRPDVAVYADVEKSLNGRPYQTYIDPGTDLTSVQINRLGPDPWVLPLQEPVWGVADNR